MESWWMSPFVIPIVAIIGGIALAMVNSFNRARVREMEIRERIAMIEHGLVPAPETDPKGFERALGRPHDPWDPVERFMNVSAMTARHRRAGMILLGVGAGLLVLLAPSFRVGGFLMVLGIAFIISSFFEPPVRERTVHRTPDGSREPASPDQAK